LLAFLLIASPCIASLVSHYEAENSAADSVGSNDGTLVNGTTFVSGPIGQAFDFDGTNDYVEIPNSSSLAISSHLTLSAWVRPESFGPGDGTGAILWKGNSIASASGQSYALMWSETGVAFRLGEGSKIYQTSSVPLPLETFSHVAATFDGTRMNLYVNGKLVTSRDTVPGQISASFGNLLIGGATTTPGSFGGDPTRFYFEGQIEDVRIYNEALQPSEIAALLPDAIPELIIVSVQDGVFSVEWPSSVQGWTLQTSEILAANNWTVVSLAHITDDSVRKTAAIPSEGSQLYARLVKP
jgi:hypothetical protein